MQFFTCILRFFIALHSSLFSKLMGTLVTKGWFLFNFVNIIFDLPNNFSLISVEKIFRCNSFIFKSVSSFIKTLMKQS